MCTGFRRPFAVALVVASAAGAVAAQDLHVCEPAWHATFGGKPGIDGSGRALAVFEHPNGTGQALFVGGSFQVAGGLLAPFVAAWDGAGWHAVGDEALGLVLALESFDDGSAPALYAGGFFSESSGAPGNHIARWDGEAWGAVGDGTTAQVADLAVWDDGSGPALYAGGQFLSAGGAAADHVAKWDGTAWSPLGAGTDDDVLALEVFDDGAGEQLYVAGSFAAAGGSDAYRIARWDGAAWSPVGGGIGAFDVVDLCVHDDGSGEALYAAGNFTTAEGITVNGIARWDGSSWSGVGGGVSGFTATVSSLAVFDDGGGAALYASGQFTAAGGTPAAGLARWDGSAWSAVDAGGFVSAGAMLAFDDGMLAGERLFITGAQTGGLSNGVGAWDGTAFAELGDGGNGAVWAMTRFDDGLGAGERLIAAGAFTELSGGVQARRIAAWDGAAWSPLGAGIDSSGAIVRALAVFDAGAGEELYVGGDFSSAGGVPAANIARWDGVGWSTVGLGTDFTVQALCVFDDGTGAALYAGGNFLTAGGVAAKSIARWDGASWTPLGAGLFTNPQAGFCSSLLVHDDGGGPRLFAGGAFTTAGTTPANYVAAWDGLSWSAVGGGTNGAVRALATFDGGSGSQLYAGGDFSQAGGLSAGHVASWDGSSWEAFGDVVGGFVPTVASLAVHDDGDGSGDRLYVGGRFTGAGGVDAEAIATWDGATWGEVGGGVQVSGLGAIVYALEPIEDSTPGEATLFAGGDFLSCVDSGDSFIARWACLAPSFVTVLGCFGNAAQLSTDVSSATLGGALPFEVQGAATSNGVAVVYAGALVVDGSGCGVLAPGFGEVLLGFVPFPLLVASDALVAGTATPVAQIPNKPALAGATIAVQAVAVDPSAVPDLEPTNAISILIGP